MTDAHVVDDAEEVEVRLTDGREFKAKVLGVDKPTDMAVIKIDARNLPTARLGNPAKVKPGDWVVAIGSPFGFENSVTQGIVSAKSRTLPDDTGSPAARAGLQPGDVILKLNDERVTHLGRLPAEIAQMKPGPMVKLEILRAGEKKDVEVTLGELESAQVSAADLRREHRGRLELAVRPLASAERRADGPMLFAPVGVG